jgi:hypothetical protein
MGIPGVPLRVLAEKIGFTIGAPYWMRCQQCSEDPDLDAVLRREFGQSILYHGWRSIEPQPGVRNFVQLNSWAGRYAKLGASRPILYGLVDPLGFDSTFGLPPWLKEKSRSQMIAALSAYVTDVVTYFKGKMSLIMVVGETNSAPGWDWLYDVVGPEYVEIAFDAARKADPSVPLGYGDFSNQMKWMKRYGATKDIVDRLKRLRLIDAVILEGWMYAGNTDLGGMWPWRKDEIIEAFQSFELPVVISEFRVILKDIKGSAEYREDVQAQLFRLGLEAAIESGVCREVILGGPCDGPWDLATPSGTPSDMPNVFDSALRPKPAYYALQSVLQEAVARKYRFRRMGPLIASDR